MSKGSPALRRAAGHRYAPITGATVAASSQDSLRTSDNLPVDSPSPASNVTTFPVGVPVPVAATANLDHVTIEDCDTLWDWVRADRAGTSSFLGRDHKNSQSFHEQIANLFALEQQRVSWFRAIRKNDVLCGFILLNPIVQKPSLAGTVHLYIALEHCVEMSAWLPSVFAALPADMILMLVDAHGTFTEILKPIGFQPNTVLTRPVQSHDVVGYAD